MSILFSDLDGTLVDTMPRFYEIMQSCMAQLGVEPLSLSTLRQRTIETTIRKISFEEAMVPYFNDPGMLAEFFNAVWKEFHKFTETSSRLFPGILETLSELTAVGWTIIVYTGRDQPRDTLLSEIERLRIDRLITDVFTVHAFNRTSSDDHPKEAMLHQIFEHYQRDGVRRWLISDLPDDMLFTRDTDVKGVGVLTGVGNEDSFQRVGVPFITSFKAFPNFVEMVAN